MSKKDKNFKELWKEYLETTKNKDQNTLEKEMIQDTKKQLLKIIEQIETANDLRRFLIQSVKVLVKDYNLLMTLLNEDKGHNEN